MEDATNSRIRFTDEEKKAIIRRCKESGLSKIKFAEQNGIKYYTLVSWFEKERNEVEAKQEKIFTQVAMPDQDGLFAEVKSETGVTIRFYKSIDVSFFQALLKK